MTAQRALAIAGGADDGRSLRHGYARGGTDGADAPVLDDNVGGLDRVTT